MLKKWKGVVKLLTVSSIVLVYATIGFLNFETRKRKGQDSEASSTTPETDSVTLKTLVGYSLEYKIRQETRDEILCKERTTKFFPEKNSRWRYDEKLDIHLYSAYYDSRQHPYRYVRVIGILPRNSSLYCQVTYETGTSVTRKAEIEEIWSAEWGGNKDGGGCRNYYPSLVGCFLPGDERFRGKIPVRVSFVDENCSGGAAVLPVRKGKISGVEKKKFVVCVKPVDFKGYNRASLEEWIGLNRLLGAEKITLYLPDGLKKTPRVLKRYEERKWVETVRFESPPFRECGGAPYEESLWKKRKIEVLAYNDCFYRNLYEAEFVVPLDLDEIIVPKSSGNWKEAFSSHFSHSRTPEYASFSVRNAYFFGDYPKEAVFHDAGARSVKPDGTNERNPEESIFRRKVRSFVLSPRTDSAKSFVRVRKTLTVFNHYAFHVLGGAIRQYVFPENVMQLNHYRKDCDPVLIDGCQRFLNQVTYDDTLERFINKISHL